MTSRTVFRVGVTLSRGGQRRVPGGERGSFSPIRTLPPSSLFGEEKGRNLNGPVVGIGTGLESGWGPPPKVDSRHGLSQMGQRRRSLFGSPSNVGCGLQDTFRPTSDMECRTPGKFRVREGRGNSGSGDNVGRGTLSDWSTVNKCTFFFCVQLVVSKNERMNS